MKATMPSSAAKPRLVRNLDASRSMTRLPVFPLIGGVRLLEGTQKIMTESGRLLFGVTLADAVLYLNRLPDRAGRGSELDSHVDSHFGELSQFLASLGGRSAAILNSDGTSR
jgi:hypothetical protein